MFVKWQDHVYDFEIRIWNHVSDSGKSNAAQVAPVKQGEITHTVMVWFNQHFYKGDNLIKIVCLFWLLLFGFIQSLVKLAVRAWRYVILF